MPNVFRKEERMKVLQQQIRCSGELPATLEKLASFQPNLILVFGSVGLVSSPDLVEALTRTCPDAQLLGCSTAGEITAEGVDNLSCTLTAVRFDKVRLRPAETVVAGMADSFGAGERIGRQLADPELKAILVFGPGTEINGSALVRGLSSAIGPQVPVTGGLAGDDAAFLKTSTISNTGSDDRKIVAAGFYGPHFRFGHGSYGGWEPFGQARKVTHCNGNILHELDGKPALDVYKRYLGAYAEGLPASGLLFPFAMLGEDHGAVGLIRTILGIDENTGSLILAGEIEQDGYLKLMHASTDGLVDGAEIASTAAVRMLGDANVALALLVSCVGRKLAMGQRVDEEVEAAAAVIGNQAVLTGFYSYGEISPFLPGSSCRLHNQTMTITCFGEA